MVTVEQIRAARALLNWSQQDLADRAHLSQTGIARLENGNHQPTTQTLNKILRAFADAGIEFIGSRGLERRQMDVRSYGGSEGYAAFFDDVYETVKKAGGDVVISGVEEKDFTRHFPDSGLAHQRRMKELGNFTMRCLICEGDYNFTAGDYCSYRWTPKALFEAVSFYVYGDKLAFLNFEGDSIDIHVIHHKKIADSFRKQFSQQWAAALVIPAEGSS